MTTITESFNTADGTTLGPNLTWTETNGDWTIVSNQANGHSTTNRARADSNLATTDHYAQAVWAGSAAADNKLGVLCRFSSSATTAYRLSYQKDGTVISIAKIVAGTVTSLATASGSALVTNDLLRFEVRGSQLTGLLNGVQVIQVTDTAITTGVRCGIEGISSIADRVKLDSFEAGDLVHAYTQAVDATATLTPLGVRSVGKPVATVVTLAPVAARAVSKAVALASTLAALAVRSVAKPVVAATTATPTVTRTVSKTAGAAATLTALISRVASRVVALGTTLTPASSKSIARSVALGTTLSPSASRLTTVTPFALGASLAPAASRTTSRVLAVTGHSDSYGDGYGDVYGGSGATGVTFGLTVTPQYGKTFSIALTAVTDVARTVLKPFELSGPWSVAVVKQFGRLIEVALTLTVQALHDRMRDMVYRFGAPIGRWLFGIPGSKWRTGPPTE